MVDLGATHGRTGTACATTPPRQSNRPEYVTLLFLAAVAILACVLFLTLGARGNWSFVLPFRGAKLTAMLLVAHAIATSPFWKAATAAGPPSDGINDTSSRLTPRCSSILSSLKCVTLPIGV